MPCSTHLLRVLPLLAATAGLPAQGPTVQIDFGTQQYVTGTAPYGEVWNDAHDGNHGSPLPLVATDGSATGITLQPLAGSRFSGANSAGTQTTQAGSPYAQLGFPPSVTRDVIYGANGAVVQYGFGPLDPNTLYDFTFTASRMGVGDIRSTDYVVAGFNGGGATLDASNNTSEIAQVAGILPAAGGTITLSVRAAATNTNPTSHYFYLGGLRLHGRPMGSPPQVLSFGRASLDVSRAVGGGAFATALTLGTNTGAVVPTSLTATDATTGNAPVWLATPATVPTGTPFSLTLDPAGLAAGVYRATLRADANGWFATELPITLYVRPVGAKNLLFYGNSYSQGNGTMPAMVNDLAEEAGLPAPYVTAALVGGQTLAFHRTNAGQVAAIQTIPAGEQWDYVVMQGHSLNATRLMSPTQFRQDAVGIVANVRGHSPQARAVLFQTWARGRGHGYYPGTFRDPMEMHHEVRDNYALAAGDIDATYGAGTATRAPVGDAVALLAFDPALYTADLSHPLPPVTVMASLSIFASLYGVPPCALDPDFTQTGSNATPLVRRLQGLGVSREDWDILVGIAERASPRSVRGYPGSDEDLLLRTGTSGLSACPRSAAATPAVLSAWIESPWGDYRPAPALLLATAFATGGTVPSLAAFPETYVRPGATWVHAQANELTAAGLSATMAVPALAPGASVLLQGFALAASRSQTPNALFTATDAHAVTLR